MNLSPTSNPDRELALRLLTGLAIGLLLCTAYAMITLGWQYAEHAPVAATRFTGGLLILCCLLLGLTRLLMWLLEDEFKFKTVPGCYNQGFGMRWVIITRRQQPHREGWRVQTPRRTYYLTRPLLPEHVR